MCNQPNAPDFNQSRWGVDRYSDGLVGIQWLLDQGYAPEKIVFAGDSAGGGLVLSTMMALRDAGRPLPAGGICLSPWLDLTMHGASHTVNRSLDYVSGGDQLTNARWTHRPRGRQDARSEL